MVEVDLTWIQSGLTMSSGVWTSLQDRCNADLGMVESGRLDTDNSIAQEPRALADPDQQIST